jgi:hypothetical protein
MLFALVVGLFGHPARTIVPEANTLVTEKVFLEAGSSAEIVFHGPDGFFYVAQPALYSVAIGTYCTSTASSDCHWYRTETRGLFALGDANEAVVRIKAWKPDTFTITVGFLTRDCCSTVWVGSIAPVSETRVFFSDCYIPGSADSSFSLSVSPISADKVYVVGFTPGKQQVWGRSSGPIRASGLSAIRFVNLGSSVYTMTAQAGDHLITLTPQKPDFLGFFPYKDSGSAPKVQYDPDHIEKLSFVQERPNDDL